MTRLAVRAGPSIDALQPVAVNQDLHPFSVNSVHFEGRLVVRVKDFVDEKGQTVPDSESGFFAENPSLTWSIQVQGRFKAEEDLEDIVFGNVFERPIRDQLPYGTSIALRFATFVDPGLQHDVWADKPWAWSPLLSTMNRLEFRSTAGADLPDWQPRFKEDVMPLYATDAPDQIADDPSARRAYFAIAENREDLKAGPDMLATFAFENGFIDFNSFSLNLPVAHFKVPLARLYAANSQPVTYICKNNENDRTFFIVQFDLVQD